LKVYFSDLELDKIKVKKLIKIPRVQQKYQIVVEKSGGKCYDSPGYS